MDCNRLQLESDCNLTRNRECWARLISRKTFEWLSAVMSLGRNIWVVRSSAELEQRTIGSLGNGTARTGIGEGTGALTELWHRCSKVNTMINMGVKGLITVQLWVTAIVWFSERSKHDLCNYWSWSSRLMTIFGRYLRGLKYSVIRSYRHNFNVGESDYFTRWWERNYAVISSE